MMFRSLLLALLCGLASALSSGSSIKSHLPVAYHKRQTLSIPRGGGGEATAATTAGAALFLFQGLVHNQAPQVAAKGYGLEPTPTNCFFLERIGTHCLTIGISAYLLGVQKAAIDKAIGTVGNDDEDQLHVAGKVIVLYRGGNLAGEKDTEQEGAANRAIRTNATAPVIRYLELDGRMLQDHMAPSYKASLERLCQDL